jgi:hypothetical protein
LTLRWLLGSQSCRVGQIYDIFVAALKNILIVVDDMLRSIILKFDLLLLSSLVTNPSVTNKSISGGEKGD